MDSSLSVPMLKSQKLSEVSVIRGQTDRISNLPDAVLCHILSFLPTKYAVGTSILSKRWECIWTSVPTLDFDESLMLDDFRGSIEASDIWTHKIHCFKDFVDRVLFLHDGLGIQKFCLSSYAYCNASYLYTWIYAAATFDVKEVDIKSSSFLPQNEPASFLTQKEMPWILFTCKTLVVLKITGAFILNIPLWTCLPFLKTLHLDSVVYVDDASIEKLLSNCPVLEDLDIKRGRNWDGLEILNISVPSLRRLSCCNFSDAYKIILNAPNLQYLSLRDDHPCSRICLQSILPCLVEAQLDGYDASGKFQAHITDGNSEYGLLEGISQVRRLSMSSETLRSLNNANQGDLRLPILCNLTHLELGLDTYYWKLLPSLLEISPCLEVLVFDQGLTVGDKYFKKRYFQVDWSHLQHVLSCLVVHLSTIKINNFMGNDDEVRLVEHFLKHSIDLKNLTINCHDFKPKSKFRKELAWLKDYFLKFARSSSACELNFTIPSSSILLSF